MKDDRQSPRIGTTCSGLLLRHEADRRFGRAAIPVTVTDIGNDGLGLAAPLAAETLLPDETVTVRCRLGSDTLQLPARVCWVEGHIGSVRLGLRLLEDVAPADTCTGFARTLERLSARAQRRPPI